MSEPRIEPPASVAEAPLLLVACDYDGVLAPIAPTPDAARTDERALRALGALAELPRTETAVISGRELDELRSRLGPHERLHLVGSHGAEANDLPPPRPTEAAMHALESARMEFQAIAARAPGALVEAKRYSVTIHVRGCEPAVRQAALSEASERCAPLAEGRLRSGKDVLEFDVGGADKGTALAWLGRRLGASRCVFLGDDKTDEDAFARLGADDWGIHVGSGPSAAVARIPGQESVAPVLEAILDARRRALSASAKPPIEQHGLLSDQRTCALVDPGGRVVWMCLPRADSSAVFASLLGGPEHGSFDVTPVEASQPRTEYRGDSMALRTQWGGITVTDFLDCSGGRAFQRAGRTDLLRIVEGSGRVRIRFAPRLDFGRVATELAAADGGITVEGSPEPLALLSPGVTWRIETEGRHQTAHAEVDLTPGAPLVLEMRAGMSNLHAAGTDHARRLASTERFWSEWARTLTLPSLHPELVKRSALALKALCYGPTGAILASPTTSLPEQLGGERNWDYRYCWPRDACHSAAALLSLGNTGVAMKLLDWLVAVVASSNAPERLRPLYDVSGLGLAPEAVIHELPGYGASRPVRVGNAADHQVQLDVFGPIVDLVARLVARGAPVTPEHWRLVESMVGAVAARWAEPDHGIWEIRGPRRHHVHTKVMCWLAVDRAISVAREVLGRVPPAWPPLREAIGAEVIERGWSAKRCAFVSSYDSDDLDAASLAIGLTGLLPADDPRWASTVEAIASELVEPSAGVLRYRFDDGLAGLEGAFHICTGWLSEAWVSLGRHAEAERALGWIIRGAGPTGLIPEQSDRTTGRGRGNYPQAYSHLALINACIALSERR